MDLNEKKFSHMKLDVYCEDAIGDRQYMEDIVLISTHGLGGSVEYPCHKNSVTPFACFFIFDGHGGVEAARYAKKKLINQLLILEDFHSDDDEKVTSAIKQGFINTQDLMFKECSDWPKTDHGRTSTSGTTVSMVMIRKKKMYVAHVGDSTVVLGKINSNNKDTWDIEVLTEDHKPDSPKELERIRRDGGDVICRAGVPRVVWKRKRLLRFDGGQDIVDMVPFLAVSRSLGDFWSYNPEKQVYTVSPEPDVSVHDIDPNEIGCIVLASDGLWNAIKTKLVPECVRIIRSDERLQGMNIATSLVKDTIDMCATRRLKADNTSVVVICPVIEESDVERADDYFSLNIIGKSVEQMDSECVEESIPCVAWSSTSHESPSASKNKSFPDFLSRIVMLAMEQLANRQSNRQDASVKVVANNEKCDPEKIEFLEKDDVNSSQNLTPNILNKIVSMAMDQVSNLPHTDQQSSNKLEVEKENELSGDEPRSSQSETSTKDGEKPLEDEEINLLTDESLPSSVDNTNLNGNTENLFQETIESKVFEDGESSENRGEGVDYAELNASISCDMESNRSISSPFSDFNLIDDKVDSLSAVRSLKRKSKSYSGPESKKIRYVTQGSKSYSESHKAQTLLENLQACS